MDFDPGTRDRWFGELVTEPGIRLGGSYMLIEGRIASSQRQRTATSQETHDR